MQLTRINETFPPLKDKKIHKLYIVQICKKTKTQEPLENLFLRRQQVFELYEQLNPIELKLNDDSFINKMKKYKNITYKFKPLGLLFPGTIINDTNQIFLTCRELSKAKTASINGNTVNILGVINLDQIKDWEKVTEETVWVNVNFKNLKDKNSEHYTFRFTAKKLG